VFQPFRTLQWLQLSSSDSPSASHKRGKSFVVGFFGASRKLLLLSPIAQLKYIGQEEGHIVCILCKDVPRHPKSIPTKHGELFSGENKKIEFFALLDYHHVKSNCKHSNLSFNFRFPDHCIPYLFRFHGISKFSETKQGHI